MAGPRDSDGHDWRRLVFVACCIVAAATGGMLVASVGSDGLAGSPIDSVLPGEDLSSANDDPGNRLGGGSSSDSGLGSLTPGTRTGAGGELGLDNETFASTATEIHFTARSSQPTYWRTASYGEYTSTSWRRADGTEPYESPIHDERGERVEYNVTLRRPAGALPTPWRPTAVDGIDGDDLGVTPDGSVQPTGTVPAGTEFTGVSHAPENDPAVLRTVDDTHPPALDRYTQLPDDVPPRLGVRTDLITEGTDSRYAAAVAVQDWLRENKNYSLDAYQRTNHVADTFVFDMSAGYCEYFATAMATMLRTQDIPTRYAVGYTSGQQTDNGVYQVRGMNAHAWVEVYFEGAGWVQFDPTPGGPRLQAQQQSLAAIGEEYDVEDPASPGETFDPDDFDTSDPDEGYDVSLNRTPVPGETVTVSVTRDGEPAPLVEVAFDGEAVGTTGRDGTVTTTVPATEQLRITLSQAPPEISPPELNWTDPSDEGGDRAGSNDSRALARGGVSGTTSALASGTATGQWAGFAQSDGADEPPPPDDNPDNGTLESEVGYNETVDVATLEAEVVYNETVDVATEAEVSIGGEVLPGNEVAVTALIGDEPLANATVLVSGETRGRTDEDGRATVRLPRSPGAATVTVEGDRFTGEQSVDVPALEVTVESDLPLALPFGPATVEAHYGDDPAVGIPVEVDGEVVATTGAEGRANVRLPFGAGADIAVTERGVRAESTVGGLLVNLVVLVVSLVGLTAGVGTLLARRGYRSPTDLRGLLWTPIAAGQRLLGGLGEYVTRLLVAGADRADRLADLRAVVGRALRTLLATLGLTTAREDRTPGRASESASMPSADYPPTGPETASDERAAVRAAWGHLLAAVSTPAATHTPGELAARAIEQDGLPADAVLTLRDAFRAAEYGERPADLDRVRAAVDAIERATADDEPPDAADELADDRPRDRRGLASDGGTER